MEAASLWVACAWFAPLAAALPLALLGRRLGRNAASGLALCGAALSLAGAFALLLSFGFQPEDTSAQKLWPWLNGAGLPSIPVGWMIDSAGARMAFLVALLSGLVHIFSIRYMRHEDALPRYFASLGLFAFSMQGVVLSATLPQTFAAWELVGLSSWLLIGFWREKREAATGSLRAFFYNRVADAAFLCGVLLILVNAGASTWTELLATLKPLTSEPPVWLILAGLGLVIGAAGKSAQFPFSVWLPGAMAGPTPVSALLHAATMVAAGVFLLARATPLLPEAALTLAALMGAASALVGATMALFATDAKKVLAGSTISQLGLMFLALGAGQPELAFFHLLTHAFFKCGLFLCVAAVVDALHAHERSMAHGFNPYDLRNMGGLARRMPWVFGAYAVCAAALVGLPLTSGFLSKESLIDGLLAKEEPLWLALSAAALMSSAMTAFYVLRHGWLMFGGEFRGAAQVDLPARVPIAWTYALPLALLTFGSSFLLFSPFDPLHASGGWALSEGHPHAAPSWTTTFLALGTASVGLALAWLRYRRLGLAADPPNQGLGRWLKQDLMLVPTYKLLFEKPTLLLARAAYRFDLNAVDRLIVRLPARLVVGRFESLRTGGPSTRPTHLSQVERASLTGLVAWIDSCLIDGLITLMADLLRGLGNGFRRMHGGAVSGYLWWSALLWAAGLALIVYWL